MRLTTPPGFRPILNPRRRIKPMQRHQRACLENARHALANPKVCGPSFCWAEDARVVGDHAGSAIGFLRSLWAREWVEDRGWLHREISIIIAGNLWDGDQRALPGNLQPAELMAWLAAHPAEQVQILLGAHDLERLGTLGQASERWLRLARSAASAALILPTANARRIFLAEWAKSHPQHPAPFAAYEHHGDLKSGARLIRRLLLVGRIVLATVSRDLHDGRPVLITHSGVTTDAVKELGVGTDAFAIAAALNRRLQEAVDRVRDDWEHGGVLPLDLGDLYHPWESQRPSSGLLATRPDFTGIAPLSADELGLNPPYGTRAVSPRQYLIPSLTQIAGHTLRERASCSQPVSSSIPQENFQSNGISVISGPEGQPAELQVMSGNLCTWPENVCCFINWTTWTSQNLGGVLSIRVVPQNQSGDWNLNVPDPTKRINAKLHGLITILASNYSRKRLLVIEEFLEDCLNRLAPSERSPTQHSLGSQLEDLHDWVKILLGGPKLSAAARLGQRWRNAYLSKRDGIVRTYPQVTSW